jgi:diguanylate cyclase (GGDEF)-like protein
MKAVLNLTIAITLAFASVFQECNAQLKKRVLVLHSYHQGLEWTDNITKGIQSTFTPYQKQYEVHYEYLDTKRNSGQAYTKQMVDFISAKNSHIEYEVVIVSDNTALKLVNEGSIHFSGDPQIVFCGINNYNKTLINKLNQVTGVIENTDHHATVELMRKLHPERNKIVVIIDRTPTGDAIRNEFMEIEKKHKGKLEFVFLRDFLLEEIPDKLAMLNEHNTIYLTTFNRDRNNNFISYAEGIEMITRSSSVPIYGSWDFYLGKGIVGGRITSGYHQGHEAGQLAIEILAGQQADKLKVITTSPNQYMFDHKYIIKHGIDISSLPHGSQITNQPPAPYERHKIFLVGITLISLTSVLIILWKYKRQQNILAREHALSSQLEHKVKERTLELEKANKELLRLSHIDGLTQIYNRRHFDSTLHSEIQRLQRTSMPISVLICDIDFFKEFNDTYGHLAGDDCIRSVANIIQQYCKRISDIVARYGGDEFGIILPNTGSNEVKTIAESILHGVEREMIPHRTSMAKKFVTLSIGVASLIPDLHTTPSSIIALADKALYESKDSGRNRVTLHAH